MTYTITSIVPDYQATASDVTLVFADGNTVTYRVKSAAELFEKINAYGQFASDLEVLNAMLNTKTDRAVNAVL